jgi:hypothetical protein
MTVALFGVDGTVVDIHVALHPTTSGLDDDRTVAHPSTSPATRQDPTREMTERVRAAIRNSGLRWPDSPVTIDLAPEVRPNTVVGCDLALACAIQAGMGTLTELQPAETAALGGLAWTGPSRPVQAREGFVVWALPDPVAHGSRTASRSTASGAAGTATAAAMTSRIPKAASPSRSSRAPRRPACYAVVGRISSGQTPDSAHSVTRRFTAGSRCVTAYFHRSGGLLGLLVTLLRTYSQRSL